MTEGFQNFAFGPILFEAGLAEGEGGVRQSEGEG